MYYECLMKENDRTLRKAKSRQYPTESIMDAHYTDDLALLINTPAKAEGLLLSLGHASRSIGLCVNSSKTKFMCFK